MTTKSHTEQSFPKPAQRLPGVHGPGSLKPPGNFFVFSEENKKKLTQTLTELNLIFNKHHRKYKSKQDWRKAIIENLAAWKMGVDYGVD